MLIKLQDFTAMFKMVTFRKPDISSICKTNDYINWAIQYPTYKHYSYKKIMLDIL